jgi:glucan biosynthesis protein C
MKDEAAATTACLLALAGTTAVAIKLADKVVPALPGSGYYETILEPAIENLPYFIFGILMSRSRAAFEFVHGWPKLWGTAALVLLGLRYFSEQHAITSAAEHMAHIAVDLSTAFACSFALLGVAQRLIKRPSRWVKFIAESAYTVYIVHYLIIVELLVFTERAGLDMPVRAGIASLGALAVGFALHAGVVQRVPLAALLLNGRWPARRRTAVAIA